MSHRCKNLFIHSFNSKIHFSDFQTRRSHYDVRIIRDNRDIYLCQNSYINKVTIEYLIDAFKTFSFSLSSNFIVSISDHSTSNSNSNSLIVNFFLRKKYRKKIDSICYLANITRLDVAKATFKLAEHLINLELDHLHAINHCL
jgi:hypothetical protein